MMGENIPRACEVFRRLRGLNGNLEILSCDEATCLKKYNILTSKGGKRNDRRKSARLKVNGEPNRQSTFVSIWLLISTTSGIDVV
jgi:hypothetical protein